MLFTNNRYDNERAFKLFNPNSDEGPIKIVNKKWYKKVDGSLVGHFLLEISVVSMKNISRINFVNHSKQSNGLIMNKHKCASAFLSYVLFKGLKNVNHLFKVDGVYDGNLISYFSYIENQMFYDLPPKCKGLACNAEYSIRMFLKYYYLSWVCEPKRKEYYRRIDKILSSIGGREECAKAFYAYINRHFDYNFKQISKTNQCMKSYREL